VPEQVRTEELDAIIDWLGETVRQTDSSLLDEWEALTDPQALANAAAGAPPPPPRPVTGNERAFTVMVRNAMFHRVRLAAQDRWEELAQLDAAAAALTDPPSRPAMTAADWEAALGAYWEQHDEIGTGPQARSPSCCSSTRARPASGRCARSSTTPRATTTPRSSRRSTSTPPTRPASPSCGPRRSRSDAPARHVAATGDARGDPPERPGGDDGRRAAA
jgi:hypothetical protein